MKKLSVKIKSSNFMSNFTAKERHADKTQIIYKFLKSKEMNYAGDPPPGKSEEKARECIAAGDKFFEEMQTKKATRSYNQAIAWAPSGSKILALAYSCRSKLLHSLQKYQSCIADITRAIESGCEESQITSQMREIIAANHPPTINCEHTPADARGLLFAPPPQKSTQIPCALKDTAINQTREYGRGIIATDDIQPGSVISIEDPYVACLFKELLLDRCTNCCEPADAMIPCDKCPFVLFCNEDCKAKACTTFHKYECPILHKLTTLTLNYSDLLGLRIVLKARCDYGSWDALNEAARRAECEIDPRYKGFDNFKIPEESKIYDSKMYAAIHMLESEKSRLNADMTFRRAMSSAILLQLLKHYTNIFCINPEEKDAPSNEWYIYIAGGLLYRHIMTANISLQRVEAMQEDEEGNFMETVSFASGAYAFNGLLNHSCVPNAHRVFIGTTAILMALRPIKKGGQILISYGPRYELKTHEERQKELSSGLFNCHCEACSNNWPLYAKLKPGIAPKSKKGKKGNKKGLNFADSTPALEEMYAYLRVLESNLPSKQHVNMIDKIRRILGLLGNVISFDDRTEKA